MKKKIIIFFLIFLIFSKFVFSQELKITDVVIYVTNQYLSTNGELIALEMYYPRNGSQMTLSFHSFPPKQLKANMVLNLGNRTTFLALKPGTTLACAVDQVVHILERNPAKAIIKIDRKEDILIQAFKESLLRDRVTFRELQGPIASPTIPCG